MKEAKGPGTIVEVMAQIPGEGAGVERRLEQCRSCRYQASITAGTIFHRTGKPLRLWFLAIFFLGRHKTGISALQLQKDLGLGSYKTAWAWLHKVRSALRERPEFRLTGLVEADETYVGARHERGAPCGGRAWWRRWWRIAASGPGPCAWRSFPTRRSPSSVPSCAARSTRPRPPCARTAGPGTATCENTGRSTGQSSKATRRAPPRSCRGRTSCSPI